MEFAFDSEFESKLRQGLRMIAYFDSETSRLDKQQVLCIRSTSSLGASIFGFVRVVSTAKCLLETHRLSRLATLYIHSFGFWKTCKVSLPQFQTPDINVSVKQGLHLMCAYYTMYYTWCVIT